MTQSEHIALTKKILLVFDFPQVGINLNIWTIHCSNNATIIEIIFESFQALWRVGSIQAYSFNNQKKLPLGFRVIVVLVVAFELVVILVPAPVLVLVVLYL